MVLRLLPEVGVRLVILLFVELLGIVTVKLAAVGIPEVMVVAAVVVFVVFGWFVVVK